MNLPDWIKPGAYGAVVGGVVVAIVGFSWGGWTTAGAASDMAKKETSAALIAALTPFCVERAMSEPNATALLAEFDAAQGSAKRTFIEKAGWATAPGTDTPDINVARACQQALTART